MSKQLKQFDEQLVLKMTLGQQFKQPFTIPEVLQSYGVSDTETAQDILQLNQYWMLLQQASKMPEIASEKILSKLEKNAEIQHEATISEALTEVLMWIFKKDRPANYADWIHQILKLARQQQLVLPRQLILKVATIARNSCLLAQVLPDIAFMGGVSSSRLDQAKPFYQYFKDKNPDILFKLLAKSSRSDWSYLMSIICSNIPEMIQSHPVEFWQSAIEQKHTPSYIDSVITSVFPPLTQLKPIYDYLFTLDNQQLDSIKNKGGLYLYIYYRNEKIYPELIERIQHAFSFDKKQHKVLMNIDIATKQAFERLRVVEDTQTRQLTEVFSSNLKEKAYDSFANGEDGARYLGQILKYLSLDAWQILFKDWSQLFELQKHQRIYVNHAFILRCALEDHRDLALWFYKQQQEWLEQSVHQSDDKNDRLYQLLTLNDAIEALKLRLQVHLNNLNIHKFWYVFKNSPQLLNYAWASQCAIEMILKDKTLISTTDSDQFDKLKQDTEWLILHSYPVDFDGLKDFFNKTEWTHLSTIVREKRELISI